MIVFKLEKRWCGYNVNDDRWLKCKPEMWRPIKVIRKKSFNAYEKVRDMKRVLALKKNKNVFYSLV